MSRKKTTKKSVGRSVPTAPPEADFHDFIARRIKFIRAKRSYSQKQLAEKAKVDQAQISQLENCRTSPKMSTFLKIVWALGIAPTDFFQDFSSEGMESKRKVSDPVDVVAQEISTRIQLKSKRDRAVGALWDGYLSSKGKDNNSLAKMLVRVFFDPQIGKNLDHIDKLPEYQRLLVGELVGELLSCSTAAGVDWKGCSHEKIPESTQLKEVVGMNSSS
jgi:transcriptional regulator with XRE-family HTH domain